MADETNPTEINIGGYPQTTTAEAQTYARKFLDKSLAGNDQSERAILGEMSANSQRAIQALRQAQQSMMGAQYDPRLKYLAAAQALGEPTKSGSTSEGLGRMFGAAGEQLRNEQQFNLDRMKAILGYQQQIAEAPDAITKAKMELQKLHETQEGPLTKEALQVMGRSIVPGQVAASSPNAKVALGEGYALGTPAFYNRVRQLDLIDQKNKAATAGTDADSYTEPDHTDAAKMYGVPASAPYPWAGASTKERKQALNSERQSALKQMAVEDQGVLQSKRMQEDIDRFMMLAQRHGTSSAQGIPVIQQITGLTQDAKEMDKISARMATLMRQPGWGRMTNYDLQLFQSANLGRDKPYATNKAIAESLRAALNNQLAWNEFQHNYFAVHKTLQGARDAFDTYLDKNPIFDPSQPGQYIRNKGRTDYKTWFRSHLHDWDPGSMGGQEPTSQYPDVTEEDRIDPAFAGLSDEEIHNSKIPAKARGGPIRGYANGGKVKDDADYKATLEDLARSLEQGATFQWGDELNAAARPGPYRENVTTERGKQERFAGSHPWSNAGLEMAGGAATTAAAAKLAQMAAEHGKGKAGMLGGLAALATKLTPKKFIPQAAVAGAGAGALAGAGSAQDAASVPAQTLEGGAVGAVAGPLAGLVAKYGVNGAMALVDKLRSRAVPAGTQKVLAALGQDKTTVDEIQTRLNRAQRQGVPSVVANVGGPNIEALAQGVASKEGDKVTSFMDDMRRQVASSNERVGDLVNKSLKPDDYATKLKELTTNLYQNARPLYDQAYKAYPKIKSDVIWDILGNSYGKKAAKQAFKYMEADGVPIGQADVTGAIKKPSLQYLDYVKRGLDDQIESAQRSGDNNLARILNGMKSRLVNELDAKTTDQSGQSLYKAARQQYAGDAEVRNALQLGRDEIFGASGMTPKDIASKVAGMSWAERDAMRTGAAEYLFQMIGNTPGTSNVAAKLANVPNMQAKLAAMFDKPGEYQQFMSALQQEMKNFSQAKSLVATQARSKAAGASADLDPSGHLGEAAYEAALASSGHPLWAGARAAKWVGNRLMQNPTANDAAGVLGLGAANTSAFDLLKNQAAQLAARQGAGNATGVAAAGGMGSVVAPEPWGNLQEAQ